MHTSHREDLLAPLQSHRSMRSGAMAFVDIVLHLILLPGTDRLAADLGLVGCGPQVPWVPGDDRHSPVKSGGPLGSSFYCLTTACMRHWDH
jgi:hypothetical protein